MQSQRKYRHPSELTATIQYETEAETFLQERGLDVEKMRVDDFMSVMRGDHSRIQNFSVEFKVRQEFIQEFGFAVLTGKEIELLRKFAPILELGSGTGYWAYELRKAGVEIVATDPYPVTRKVEGSERKKHNRYSFQRTWTNIEMLDGIQAIRRYPQYRTLMLVWPNYNHSWAANALSWFKGEHVIYVGGGGGGRTADDRFHQLLERDWSQIEEVAIPQFYGLHDRLMIFKRRS